MAYMRNGIRWTGYRRWCSACTTIGRLTLVGQLVAHVAALPACADAHVPTAVIREDTELVGLWRGPVEGPWGGSVLTLRLRADSTMTADNENPRYRQLDGVWTVSGNCLVVRGTPGDGIVVTLVANAPFVHLKGTWSSSGAGGTFDLAKR